MASPVMASSSATAMGSRLGMRIRPPAPAIRPRLASGMPKVACSAATTRSHESMISKPPASAEPLTAAMIGLGKSRWVRPPKPPLAPDDVAALAAAEGLEVHAGAERLVAAPGDHDDPAVRVVGQLVHGAAIAWLTPPLMALRASGRLMVRISTCPAAFPQHFVCHGAPFAGVPPPAGAGAAEATERLGGCGPQAGRSGGRRRSGRRRDCGPGQAGSRRARGAPAAADSTCVRPCRRR